MLADRNPDMTVDCGCRQRCDGREQRGRQRSRRFRSLRTGLPAQLQYAVHGACRARHEVVLSLSDWRDVSGIRLPHKFVIEQGGQKFADATVTGWNFERRTDCRGVKQETMRRPSCCWCARQRLTTERMEAETKQERGKRVVDEALAALGGESFWP